MDREFKHTVLVTGFGPFGKHVINASWEAVKELNNLWINSKELKNVRLIVEQIPVAYENVATCVPKLWEQHNPSVVLHVGVSHKAECLMVEYRAHKSGYIKPDINKKCPDESNVIPGVLETEVNVKEVCDIVNENFKETGCNACVSEDAGRYLCEYIFCQSLNIKPLRTLFVHVPDFDKYSSAQTAKGLYAILCYMIKSLKLD